ncbi:MAG: DcaP family trimeric outer membrane transporter [Ferruginibacter sp.]
MRKKIFYLAIAACCSTGTTSAQTPAPTAAKPAAAAPSVTIYGFVRNDMFYDTRQNTFVREGQLDLYPKDKDIQSDESDYNKKSQLNILGILARFGVKVTGPDAFKAKTSAVLEGDFFGQADVNIGSLRLRHGYVKLDWAKSSLTLGQTWYPLFIPECFPGVVNFNTGIPIAPFGWAGQVKYTAKFDEKTSLSFTAYKPREFAVANVNAADITNAASLNAAMPDLNAHLQYKGTKLLIGAQADFGMLKPYVKYGATGSTKTSSETVSAFTAMAYAKFTGKKVSVKTQAIIGQNTTQWVMMGGYFGYKATPTSIETYKPAKTTAVWADVYGNGKKVVPGLFVGYSSNNGANANATAAYGRAIGISGRGIKDLIRVSPRLDFISGKLSFRNELEFTQAQYGVRNNSGKVTGATDKITNVRFTFSTVYNF